MEVIGPSLREDPVQEALAAETAGFSGVRVVDHFVSEGSSGRLAGCPHAFVTLAAAAAVTRSVTLTETVMSAGFRHPVELAQATGSLDRISGGRAELGLGAGWRRSEYAAVGLPFLEPRQRIVQVLEAAAIARQMFRQDGCVAFRGTMFTAQLDAPWSPLSHVPDVVIGVSSLGFMRKAAAAADRVDIIHVIRDEAPCLDEAHRTTKQRMQRLLDAGRAAAGAAQRSAKFSASVFASLSTDEAEVARRREALAAASGAEVQWLDDELLYVVGRPQQLLDSVAVLASLGIDRVTITLRPRGDPAGTDALLSMVGELRKVEIVAETKVG
jgi:alkanesulfonate monooxygenase SsuD/methylene tetrahydromethanopterin reductase-like flavin-dependent oxidoreductase (luciferase family)